MLFCNIVGDSPQEAEDLAVFASQLAAIGVMARVPVQSVPAGLSRNAQFDLAPYLIDRPPTAGDAVVLLGADRLTDAALVRLRRLADGISLPCRAFGSFPTQQAAIGTRARLAYVFGQEPELHDTGRAGDGRGPVFGVPRRRITTPAPAMPPRLLLVGPDLADPAQAAALIALSLHRSLRTAVLTDGRAKQAWQTAHGRDIALYHFGEMLPADVAARVDVCVCLTPLQHNYRLRSLVANLTVAGTALIDGSQGHAIARSDDAFIRGPFGLAGLAGFLLGEILPNRGDLAEHARASKSATALDPAPIIAFLGVEPSAPAPALRPSSARSAPVPTIFMPTNGVGLGHAQRCALIADALDRSKIAPVFAAFPSCTRLLKSHGLDVMPLVGRTTLHRQSHEHDLANYLRLRGLAGQTGAGTLVFDGGYVFDSVYRTVLEQPLTGIWIRRGLWQAGQDNAIALDREKAFARVIVPAEAFDELNASYSRGEHLHTVGPVVQRVALAAADRAALRADLAERYRRPFDRLVVSLLGAGVAADRGGQIQAICGMLERRSDLLHLVLVWPSATLEPAWFSWRNSRVIKTQHAAALASAADLCVSAAGYNSFHEALYNQIPAIFVPQMGSFMDDQRARARSASDRGLAGMVEAHELMTLERMVTRFLDGGEAEVVRGRLAAADLPEPGNARAARLIEEVAHGPAALEHNPVPDRPARRG